MNVMHVSIDITDIIYSRMNIDEINDTITNMGYEEPISITGKNNGDIPVSELLASLPIDIRKK